MTQLTPIFRAMPPILFAFGIVMTIANIAEVQSSASAAGVHSSMPTEVRISYLASFVRCFNDLFYFWGIAALVAAANRLVEAKTCTS